MAVAHFKFCKLLCSILVLICALIENTFEYDKLNTCKWSSQECCGLYQLVNCDGYGFDLGMHSNNGSHSSSAWYGLNLRFIMMNRYLAFRIHLLLAGDVSVNPGLAKYQSIRTVISSNRQ